MFGSEFFLEFLDRPGGLLRYAGRFLTQFYHYEWLGALTNCLLITCFAVLFHLVLRRLRRTVWVLHTLLPCILLLTVLRHNVIPITLELLTMSAAFLGYLSLRRRVVRQVYALTAIPALYLIAGGCFWFFVVWVTASEWLARPRSSNLTFKLLYAVLAVCLPLAAYRWLLLIPLSNAFTYPLNVYVASSSSSVIMLSAHVLLVGYMLVVPFAERISRGTRPGSAQDSTRHMAVRVVLLIVLSALLLRVSYNSEEGESSDYHELYKRRQWDAILKKAKHNPWPDLRSQFITNRALFHKGKLLDEMFNYAQVWGTRGLVLDFAEARIADVAQTDLSRAMLNSDLFFEMGHVNAAFRHAYNHMTEEGRTYENLKRLAECNMVNGNYALAHKYLNLLERTLFHRQFARQCKRLIADSSAAVSCFAELKARLPAIELDMRRHNFIPLFTLVNSNTHNRMAFDYLIAWCLLDKRSMPMIAENLHFLKDAGYTAIPTHLQEAIVMLQRFSGTNIETPGFKWNADIVSRIGKFGQLVLKYPDGHSAQRALRSAFGGTYMYYYAFESVPLGSDAGPAHYYVGNTLYSEGMVDLAVTHYRHALRLDPEFVQAHIKLGDALMSLDRPEEAAEHYREALRIKPDSNEARENLDRISGRQTERGG